jgi:LysM repeat protein
MKKSFLLAAIVLSCTIVFAQNELLIQGSEKKLFLTHVVAPKENFYAIGRLYNIPAKDIATANGLDMEKGLAIGQTLKIPLTAVNFSQKADKGRPLYYVVGAAEGLYRVSVKNNGVLMANLRKWNHLPDDKIETGQKLIVGYLVSPQANQIVQHNPPAETKPQLEEVKTKVPPKDDAVAEKVLEEKKTLEDNTPEEKKTLEEKKPEAAGIKTVSNPVNTGSNNSDGGYFKSQYNAQSRSQGGKMDATASAGIFKTASGWQDAKYYALMDKVEPGTIVRIVNPTNNKVIYAKVLGEMSGIRQNQGYDVRISSAAASALDIVETDKFVVKVNY